MNFYQPSEDSYFLAETIKNYILNLKNKKSQSQQAVGYFLSLKLGTTNRSKLWGIKPSLSNKNANISVLDMGTGSGIQSKNLIEIGIKKQNILAVDINEKALKQAKKLKIKTIKSDLFEKVNRKYNLIIFNPPYLPENKYDKLSDTTGGKKGDETIIRFIKKLKSHLAKDGICFLLTSSLTPEKTWKAEAEKHNLSVKKTAEKNLFFEKLYVWKIRK